MAPMTQSGTKEFTSCKRAPATRTQVRSSRTEKPGKRPIWIALLADSEEERKLEARGRIELPIKVLQTFALPLGYRAPGPELRDSRSSGSNNNSIKPQCGICDSLFVADASANQATTSKNPKRFRLARG